MFKRIIQQLLHRPRRANKYDFGHVLIIGGAKGMVGAPYLAGMAALRMGAGLVTVASTAEVVEKLEDRTVELLTLRLPTNTRQAAQEVEDYIKRRYVAVVVLGPGMTPEFARLTTELIGRINLPMVCDASAATVFKGQLDRLREAKNDLVLTPHDGELFRLTSQKMPTALEKRREIVRVFARQYSVVLVAKGNPTLVAHQDGRVYVNPTGTSALATAGTGDVLAGMIAAARGQTMPMWQAAELATYVHGLAGELAAREKTEAGVIASDVIDKIPAAMKQRS